MTFVDTTDEPTPRSATDSDIERLRHIVTTATAKLFAQIHGGRIRCESEATLQLHLGRIISMVADLELVDSRETLSIELEKPLADPNGNRGRIDIWFRIMDGAGIEARCAIELKFFKQANHREPNNRYDVFTDIARLERCADVADIGFMLVGTDHSHYASRGAYSERTQDFDFRDGRTYRAGTELSYRTDRPYGPPITLAGDYEFGWSFLPKDKCIGHVLLEVMPRTAAAAPAADEEAADRD